MPQTAHPPKAQALFAAASRRRAARSPLPPPPGTTARSGNTAPEDSAASAGSAGSAGSAAPIAVGPHAARKARIAVASTAVALSWLYAHTALAQSAPSCAAHSAATPPTVVELYTSEGCSSCPPADRWLSSLKGRPGVLALAFHVDYWDRLGWVDRFASPAYTQRQAQLQRSSGAGFSYTPQVRVDGVDWRGWPDLPSAARAASPVEVRLAREANTLVAHITPNAHTPTRLSAYWFSLQDDQVSAVKAGENRGVTLRHDHVVRDYRPVAAWTGTMAQTLRLDLGTADTAATTSASGAASTGAVSRRGLVVTDAQSGRPVQAVVLGC